MTELVDPPDPAIWADMPRTHAQSREAIRALRLIGGGCERYVSGLRCWDTPRTVDARYDADRWCSACIAQAVLDERPLVFVAPLRPSIIRGPNPGLQPGDHFIVEAVNSDGTVSGRVEIR